MKKAGRILVERAIVDRNGWLRMFRQLVADIRDHVSKLESRESAGACPDWDPREPLIWAYCVLQSMPTTWRQDYKRLKERTGDGTGIEDGVHRLRARHYRYELIDTVHLLRLRWLATLVRTLDWDLSAQAVVPSGNPGERWSPSDWQVPGYPCFVVPVDREHRLRDGKPAERRSMRFHAILPTRVGEYEVRLALHPAIDSEPGGAGSGRHVYGAAMFEGLEIGASFGEDGFVVEQAFCAGQWDALTGHLAQACENDCEVLMWPETVVPADMVERLAARLSSNALAQDSKIPIIIPGSWHVPRQDGGQKRANRTVALDGRGNRLFHYDKRMKFEYKGHAEAIEPGTILQILVMERRLVSIGICLDFCDDTDTHAYRALDVDLVLIPSMGFRTTAEAHARQARALQTLHETQVFVVQQAPVERGGMRPAEEPLGFSFVMPPAPGAPAIEQHIAYRSMAGRAN